MTKKYKKLSKYTLCVQGQKLGQKYVFFELKQGVCTGVKNGQILTFFLTHFWQFVHTVYSKFLTSFSENKNAGSVPKNTKFLVKKMVEKCRRKKKFDKNCQKFDKNCQKFDNFLTFFFSGGPATTKITFWVLF